MSATDRAYRVLVTGPPMADEATHSLEQRASCRFIPSPPKAEQIIAIAEEDRVDGMIVRQGRIHRNVLEASPNLKIVVKHGVGVDNIDVWAATELGIPVCITPNANYQSVAEHALALMFALSRNLICHDRKMRAGVWSKMADQGSELYAKCLGIIGMGRIGMRLAELVRPLEMEVLGFDALLPPDRFPPYVRRVASLDELLRRADYVSIHCPKTPETENLIGDREFGLMKGTAILINTARGGIVEETALIRALEDGRIGGAGLDCFDSEPLPEDSPLLRLDERLLLTPHLGGVTRESLARMGCDAVDTLLDFLDGKRLSPDVVVNPEALD